MSRNENTVETMLAEFESDLQKRNFRERSIKNYLSEVRRFISWLEIRGIVDLASVKAQTIKEYQTHLFYFKRKDGKALAASTQGQKLLFVKMFFRHLEERGAILFNPARDVELPIIEQRLPKNILEYREIMEIISAIKGKDAASIRDRLIFELLYMTGVRIAELRGIRLEDIDFEHSVLRVDQGKGGKTRFIPLLSRTLGLVRRYTNGARPELLRGKTSEYLLLDDAGTRMDSNSPVSSRIRRYLQESGIRKKITAHSFRHTFATALLKNGASIRHIQKLLGHERLKTTLVYTHLSIEDLKKVHNKFHPFEGTRMKEAIP